MIEQTDVRCDRKTCFALNVSFWTTCLTETRSTLVYRKRFRNLNGSQNLLAKIGTERILVSFYTWESTAAENYNSNMANYAAKIYLCFRLCIMLVSDTTYHYVL